MKGLMGSVAVGACLLALSAGVAFADNLHRRTATTGQTGSNVFADCEKIPELFPGAVAKTNPGTGSPFGPNGNDHYAGEDNPATNPKAVSQYDNACAQAAAHQLP